MARFIGMNGRPKLGIAKAPLDVALWVFCMQPDINHHGI
jgi:hypothetical protein